MNKKNFIFTIFVAIAMIMLCPQRMWANWTYDATAKTLTNGSITLHDVTCESGTSNLTIGIGQDQSITTLDFSVSINGGYKVTTIGSNAFYNCTSLTSVNLPECLVIEGSAFGSCTSLSSINLPKCTTIESYAFYNCTSLTSVNLPECLVIEGTAFAGCTSLKSLNAPKCTTFGMNALNGCTSLTSVYIPSVQVLDSHVFYGFTNLTSVDISSCPRLSSSAFRGCTNLKSLTLSSHMTYIDSHAFYNSGITSLYINSLAPPTVDSYAFEGMQSDAIVYVPASTLSVYQSTDYWKDLNLAASTSYTATGYQIGADKSNGGSVSITNSNGETVANGTCFTTATSLTLTATPNNAYKFVSWTDVNGNVVSESATYAFTITADTYIKGNFTKAVTDEDRAALETYKTEQSEAAAALGKTDDSEACKTLITNAQTSISALTYDEEKTLDQNKANVDAIVEQLKSELEAQRTLEIYMAEFEAYKTSQSDYVATIKTDGSTECSQLITDAQTEILAVTYDKSKTLDENKAIVDEIVNTLKQQIQIQIDINAGVAWVYDASAQTLTNSFLTLKNVTCNGTELTIGKQDKGRNHLPLGKSVYNKNDRSKLYTITEIASYAFYNWVIYSITLPKKLKKIEDYAFLSANITPGSITIPASVTYLSYYAFYDNATLKEIVVEDGNTAYSSQDGVVYDKNKEKLLTCPAGKTGDLTVADGVKIIESNTFYGSSLTNVTLSESVTDLYTACFAYSNIKSVNNLENVERIYGEAFMGSPITSISLPSCLKNLEREAFTNCTSLKSVAFHSCPQVDYTTFTNYSDGTYTPLEGVSYTLDLDDTSYMYDGTENYFPSQLASASYTSKRSNIWSTIVLPFSVTDAGNADYELYSLTDVSDDALVLTKTTTLAAGVPAFVRSYSGNVMVSTGEAEATTTAGNADAVDGLTLTGTFTSKNIADEDGYAISNNIFWNIADLKNYGGTTHKVTLSPFRAYLAGTLTSGAKTLGITIGEVDAIDALNAVMDGKAEYYDLSGKRISDLQKGVNIVKYGNGNTKKVIIK